MVRPCGAVRSLPRLSNQRSSARPFRRRNRHRVRLEAGLRGNRRRVLVFRRPKGILIEPVGVDDFPESRIVAWMLKRPGGNRNIAREEDIPADYREFELAPCIKWITGPSARSGYAALVHEDDHESLIRLALVRERHRAQEPVETSRVESAPEPESVGDATSAPTPILARPILEKLASYSKEYLEDHLLASAAGVHEIGVGVGRTGVLVPLPARCLALDAPRLLCVRPVRCRAGGVQPRLRLDPRPLPHAARLEAVLGRLPGLARLPRRVRRGLRTAGDPTE